MKTGFAVDSRLDLHKRIKGHGSIRSVLIYYAVTQIKYSIHDKLCLTQTNIH